MLFGKGEGGEVSRIEDREAGLAEVNSIGRLLGTGRFGVVGGGSYPCPCSVPFSSPGSSDGQEHERRARARATGRTGTSSYTADGRGHEHGVSAGKAGTRSACPAADGDLALRRAPGSGGKRRVPHGVLARHSRVTKRSRGAAMAISFFCPYSCPFSCSFSCPSLLPVARSPPRARARDQARPRQSLVALLEPEHEPEHVLGRSGPPVANEPPPR